MKVVGKVYEESWENSRKFKLRNDNRDISEANVQKLVRSFIKYGWCGEPITVNKDMYVIAGQHRLLAAIKAHINIKYIIEDKEVSNAALRDMSMASKKWTALDYINSMADGGNQSCVMFRELHKQYVKTRKIIPLNTLAAVVTKDYGKGTVNSIANEDFKFSISDYEEACILLDKIEDIVKPCKNNKTGRFDYTCNAVLFMLDNGADYSIFKARMESNAADIKAVSNVEQAVEMLETVYNKRTKVNDKKYFVSAYREYTMRKKLMRAKSRK